MDIVSNCPVNSYVYSNKLMQFLDLIKEDYFVKWREQLTSKVTTGQSEDKKYGSVNCSSTNGASISHVIS